LRNLAETINSVASFDQRNGDKIEISVSLDTLDVILFDSNIPVPELLEYSASLFYRAPVDRRNALEKLIDVFGIEYVYATLGVFALVSLVVLLRSLSFYAIVSLGAGTIIKVVAFSAYLVNLPINFINEFKKLQAEHQAALLEPIPEGCFGREKKWTTQVMTFFSTSQLLDPCVKYQQRQTEPIFKMSVTSVLTSSFFDMVGPAFTTSGRHLRQILDVLLDGHGIMTQGLYLGVFVFVFALLAFGTFLKLTGFRFKLSSIFLGIECGPTQPTINEKMASQIALAIAEQMANKKIEPPPPKNAIKATSERLNVETICQVTDHGDSESSSSFEQVQ